MAPQESPGNSAGPGIQADVRDAFLPALLRQQNESHGHAGRVPLVPHQQVPAPLPGDAVGAAPGAQHRPGRAQRPGGSAAHLQQPFRGAGGEESAVRAAGAGAERPVPAAPGRLRALAALLRTQKPKFLTQKTQKTQIPDPKKTKKSKFLTQKNPNLD